jgi:micrococcal nuclease
MRDGAGTIHDVMRSARRWDCGTCGLPNRRGRAVFLGRHVVAALLLAVAALGHPVAPAAAPRVIQGVPRVLDGDTIVVSGLHVRLNGLDAEEVSNPPEPHGAAAQAGMQSIVGIGAPVRCVLNGDRSHERYIGTCFNMRGQDIAAELIRLGLALDCARYSGGRYRFLEPAGARLLLRQKPYCG